MHSRGQGCARSNRRGAGATTPSRRRAESYERSGTSSSAKTRTGQSPSIPATAVLDADDPEEQLRLNARNSRAAKERLAGIFNIIRQATPIELEIAELWNRIQTEYDANQRTIVRSLATKGALRPGLGIDRATDILWTVNHPDNWQLLVEQRRWTPSAYERWCATLACAQLLA